MFTCLFSGKFGMQLAWILLTYLVKTLHFGLNGVHLRFFCIKYANFLTIEFFFRKPYWMYGEKVIIFIELIYPSFKWDEAWNTAVNTCRDINKNMKVVNFPLIFAWRQWVLIKQLVEQSPINTILTGRIISNNI